MRFPHRSVLLCIWPLLASGIHAHEVEARHGAIEDGTDGLVVEGGAAFTLQAASVHESRYETQASFDLLSILPLGSGLLTAYIEGSTTPRDDGVSTLLGEANSDAGTALDGSGNGRLQVSELYFDALLPVGRLYAGLIDPTGFLDGSEVANDETRQFIGSGFVNNPTIDFPDYTLGFAWHDGGPPARPGIVLFLGGSNGLGDNPDASYSELHDIHDSGKGVFAAAELFLPWSGLSIRPGFWINTAEHEKIGRPGSETHNCGVYASIDGQVRKGRRNLRLGAASEDVSTAARFAAVAFDHPLGNALLGGGIARTHVSDRISGPMTGNTTQAEVYARLPLTRVVELTSSVQWLRNSGFNLSNSGAGRRDAWAGTLRVTLGF